jgi:hypothetical protein
LQPDIEPLPGLPPIHNPLVYLPAAKPLFDLFIGAGAALCGLVGIGRAVAALVVRFRRARGIERQQLMWFIYAAALVPGRSLSMSSRPGSFSCCSPWYCRWCRSVSASRSCATACTRSTGLSPAPWSTGCSRWCLALGMRLAHSCSCWWPLLTGIHRAGWSPPLRWLQPRCSNRPAGVSRPRSTGATTPPPRRNQDDPGVQRPPARPGRPGDAHSRAAAVVDQTMKPTMVSLWLRPSAEPSRRPARI